MLNDHMLTVNFLLTLFFCKALTCVLCPFTWLHFRLLPSQSLLIVWCVLCICSHWCDSYCFYWLFSVLNFFPPDSSLYSFTKITVSVSKLFQGCNLQQGFHHLHLPTEVSECYGEIIKIIANLFQTSVAWHLQFSPVKSVTNSSSSYLLVSQKFCD